MANRGGRYRVLAGLFGVALLVGGILYFRGSGAEREKADPAASAVPVVLTRAEERDFAESLTVQGDLKSRNFALVSPQLDGLLREVRVREGDPVVAGKTLLFVVDDEKLRKEVEMARQTLGAARFAREQSAAGLQRAEVELRRAEKDLGRFRSLRDENAVSLSRYDDAEALRDQLLSLRRASAKGLALAGEEERKAAAALRIAERNLRDARAYAPLSGRVSRRMAEPGEMGSKGKPVIRIDDVSDIEASAFLPGQVYPRVLRGKTRVRVGVQGLEDGAPGRWLGEAPVSYKSPVVDPALRTFEVKCRLAGDGERIVPGCLVDLRILLGERRGLGVPSEAVLERGGRRVVFLAEGRVARMVPVETGLESEGWTEIRKGNLRPGSPVVTKGQFLLNDGSPLRIGGTASGGADGKGQP